MLTRRQFLKGGAVGGAALLVPWEATGQAWAAIPGGSLDPRAIAKYVAPLVVPPVMPPLTGPRNHAIDRYATQSSGFFRPANRAHMPSKSRRVQQQRAHHEHNE